MSFEVRTRELGRVIALDAAGRMTLEDGRTRLRDEIHVHSERGRVKFLLNLSRVEFIDSYGVGELARCFSVARQRGGDLRLVAVSRKVAEMLEVTRLHSLFLIYEDEAAAVKGYS